MYATVAKGHLKDCGSDQINLTSENAYLKNYVFLVDLHPRSIIIVLAVNLLNPNLLAELRTQ